MNTLVVIGWLGLSRAYLNVPRAEAIKRYWAAENPNDPVDEAYLIQHKLIKEFTFDDEFWVYDVGAISG